MKLKYKSIPLNQGSVKAPDDFNSRLDLENVMDHEINISLRDMILKRINKAKSEDIFLFLVILLIIGGIVFIFSMFVIGYVLRIITHEDPDPLNYFMYSFPFAIVISLIIFTIEHDEIWQDVMIKHTISVRGNKNNWFCCKESRYKSIINKLSKGNAIKIKEIVEDVEKSKKDKETDETVQSYFIGIIMILLGPYWVYNNISHLIKEFSTPSYNSVPVEIGLAIFSVAFLIMGVVMTVYGLIFFIGLIISSRKK